MGIDDVVNTETGVIAGVTAAAVSPKARELFRRGAVYSLAGVMKAGDVTVAAAKGAFRGAQAGVAGSDGSGRRTQSARSGSRRGGTARSKSN